MKHLRITAIVTILFSLIFPMVLYALELDSWPREVMVSSGTVTIYQPQIESFEKNRIKGRVALAYHGTGKDIPIFGVAWFEARVQIDRQQRIVQYETLEITDSRFPEKGAQTTEELNMALNEGIKTWQLTSSLDELTTALAAMDMKQKTAASLKTDPPEIIYVEYPALLIVIDGKEVLQKIEGSDFRIVANSPYPIFLDSGGIWYINTADQVWYQAAHVDGPWQLDSKPPLELVQMIRDRKEKYQGEVEPVKTDMAVNTKNSPAIIVTHKPAELIVSDGKAVFTPVTDNLLAIENSDSNVFMDVQNQNYFLVISGRWYKAKNMNAKWSFVASDNLPATFADIPENSRYGDVRAYVAGTDEAREAVMDTHIPETAAVKRDKVDLEVTYDGQPKFEKISGTDLSFAINCADSIIMTGKGDKYYLVRNAVWFISSSPTGPWEVSDHAPPGIADIPPSSPVYNTKYVYVYDSTPDVVYVGYTPGYVGSYIYGPTIVYGTGWYYRPWVSPHYYYPQPCTWGFSASYNPWSGWGFGLSWSSGPFHFGFHSGGGFHGPFWRPRWYGPGGYRPAFNQVNISNININRNNFNNISNHTNLYRNNRQQANIQNSINARGINGRDRTDIQNRMAGRPGKSTVGGTINKETIRNKTRAVHDRNFSNNVLADEKGNILRQNNGQWQQLTNGGWQKHNIPATPGAGASGFKNPSGYKHQSSIDRQQFSRLRAVQRSTPSFTGRTGGRGHGRSGGLRSR